MMIMMTSLVERGHVHAATACSLRFPLHTPQLTTPSITYCMWVSICAVLFFHGMMSTDNDVVHLTVMFKKYLLPANTFATSKQQ